MEILKKINYKSQNLNTKPITIAFLGDSVTQGCFEVYFEKGVLCTVFENKYAYSEVLKDSLRVLYPSANINIINSGISGDSSTNGLSRLERDILNYNPDLVVVCYGLNDVFGGENGVEKYCSNLKQIFNKIKNLGIECIFMTPNMMNTTNHHTHEDTKFIDISTNFAKVQNAGMLDNYINAAKIVAKNENIKICDCYSKWKKMSEYGVNTTNLLANGLNHPVRELQKLFAYSLLETMFED